MLPRNAKAHRIAGSIWATIATFAAQISALTSSTDAVSSRRFGQRRGSCGKPRILAGLAAKLGLLDVAPHLPARPITIQTQPDEPIVEAFLRGKPFEN
jgi:hypothetical protein